METPAGRGATPAARTRPEERREEVGSLPPEVGDTVRIPAGRHEGETGTLVGISERVGPDGRSHVGTVLLPDGSLLGPYEMNELERTNRPPDTNLMQGRRE